MELFSEEELLRPKKKKTIKGSTILIVLIIILTILLLLTMVSIIYLKGTILTIKLDGNDAKDLESVLVFEEKDKVYIPIIKMAKVLGYSAYNGDYITRSEDDLTKCYVETPNEIISFTLDSNVLTKVINGQSQQIKLLEPIKEINQELYVSSECAKDALNIKFYYNPARNQINIQTLNYLYTNISKWAINNNEDFIQIEETYENQTAVLEDMVIVKNTNEHYGVLSTSGETVLQTQYDSIEYLRATSEFLVSNNKKKGIISKDKKTKIELIYDSVKIITNKNDIFYLVEKSGLFGLLNKNGEIIIHPEYEQIGIDVSAFSQNGVTNGYILYNQLVPVKSNKKWGLININGQKVTEFIYDSFGCPNGKNNLYRTYGVIEVPEYNLIVGCQEGKYNLVTLDGKWIFEKFILDSVYIKVSEGKNVYYITSGETTKELIGFLEEKEIPKPMPIQ